MRHREDTCVWRGVLCDVIDVAWLGRYRPFMQGKRPRRSPKALR